ncbi:unnamed protein product [Paramecium sonneborni]|uniref:Pyruvate dehydrogenase E1 component subunit beta n=1 Tax=Paramecium sonneborni TaxID=65129 RepID=A0A8S1RRE4_9CILI|nr:unnamed protein product [Paramecium sonneborni]
MKQKYIAIVQYCYQLKFNCSEIEFARMTSQRNNQYYNGLEIVRDSNFLMINIYISWQYKGSKSFYDSFGKSRVQDTPITEVRFDGFECCNILILSLICNQNSNLQHYMNAGGLKTSIIFRAIMGIMITNVHNYLLHGLNYFVPYDCDDARDLLKTAVRNPNPVVFLENQITYMYLKFKTILWIMITLYQLKKQNNEPSMIINQLEIFNINWCRFGKRRNFLLSYQSQNLETLNRNIIIESIKKTNKQHQ